MLITTSNTHFMYKDFMPKYNCVNTKKGLDITR
jgi:hypothetical protein